MSDDPKRARGNAKAKAKAAGQTRYSTGKPCVWGHMGERFVSTGSCIECLLAHNRTWRAANPENGRRNLKRFLDKRYEERNAPPGWATLENVR